MFNFTRCNFLKFKSTEKGAGKKGWVIKHKWERPLRAVPISSLVDCSTCGVRLRLSWLAEALSSLCLRILSILFQPIAFWFCLLQHHLPAVPSALPTDDLPGRSVLRIQCGTSLTISTSAAWNISNFSAFLFPGIIHKTFASLFSRSKLNLLMNDWRFFRLTERSDHLFSSNL